MNCPRCHTSLQEMSNHNVKIDVCYNGCGGIWFDPRELKKMDEHHEADESFLQKLSQSQNKTVSTSEKLNCLSCNDQPMYRRFFSVKRVIELDECPQCAGMWLDAGELTHIYSLFKTEADRKKAADEYFNEVFQPGLDQMKKESQEKLESKKSFARALRFILPSYYISGKQGWGSF